jgi:hypothetical protein
MSFIEKTQACCGAAFTFGTGEQITFANIFNRLSLARSADIRLTSKDKEL